MSLKPAIAAKFNSLNQTAIILGNLNHEADVITAQLQPMIQEIEAEANCKLEFDASNAEAPFTLINLKDDFVRTRYNGETKTMLALRTKIFGLPIEVKVMKLDKDGELEFSATNAQVAESLIELAGIVSAMPESMLEKGHFDWARVPGEVPNESAVDDEGSSGLPSETLTEGTDSNLPDETAQEAAPSELDETEQAAEQADEKVEQTHEPAVSLT